MELLAKIAIYILVINFYLGVLLAAILILIAVISRIKRAFKKKFTPEPRPKFSHAPMDLRMKPDPCDTCVRWSECNGVDDDCPRKEK